MMKIAILFAVLALAAAVDVNFTCIAGAPVNKTDSTVDCTGPVEDLLCHM